MRVFIPDYFDRLWCVFELASYVHRQGTERLTLLPLHVSTRVISLMLTMCPVMFNAVLTTIVAPTMLDGLVSTMFSLLAPLVTPNPRIKRKRISSYESCRPPPLPSF